MMGGEKEGDGDGLGRFHGIFSEVCLFYFSISNRTCAKYALETFLRIRVFFLLHTPQAPSLLPTARQLLRKYLLRDGTDK